MSKRRECGTGRATAGSQLQTQICVNEHPDELNRKILASLPTLPSDVDVEWVSPLLEADFAEHGDEEFLSALQLDHLDKKLVGGFWPRGGPCWDALAILRRSEEADFHGVLLVEAKSHRIEVCGSGCGAGGDRRDKIRAALQLTADWLHVPFRNWWLGPLYQQANRLAHLYFFREIAGIPAWLVNLYFLNDPYRPTTRQQWCDFLPDVKAELGLTGVTVPFAADVFVDVEPAGDGRR